MSLQVNPRCHSRMHSLSQPLSGIISQVCEGSFLGSSIVGRGSESVFDEVISEPFISGGLKSTGKDMLSLVGIENQPSRSISSRKASQSHHPFSLSNKETLRRVFPFSSLWATRSREVSLSKNRTAIGLISSGNSRIFRCVPGLRTVQIAPISFNIDSRAITANSAGEP